MAGINVKSGASTQSEGPRKYIGVVPCNVIAINPTKTELDFIYGKPVEREPKYVFEKDDKTSVLINIWLKSEKPVGEKKVIFNSLKIWISDGIVLFNDKDGTEKCRIIDDYGECANITSAQYQAGMPPQNSRVTGNFRPAKRGEETLVSFIKAWLNVEESTKWDSANKKWIPNDPGKVEQAKITYDWERWMTGDVEDLKALVEANEDKVVQVVAGVEKGSDNAYRQAIWDGMFMRSWTTKFDYTQTRIDGWMNGEVKVLVDKDKHEYKKVKRSEVYQFTAAWIHEWQLPTATFNQGSNGMPSVEQATAQPQETKKDNSASAWGKFVSGESEKPSVAASANELPVAPVPDDNFGVEQGNPDDLPF